MKSPRRGEHPNQTIRVRFELSFIFAEPAGHGSQEAAGRRLDLDAVVREREGRGARGVQRRLNKAGLAPSSRSRDMGHDKRDLVGGDGLPKRVELVLPPCERPSRRGAETFRDGPRRQLHQPLSFPSVPETSGHGEVAPAPAVSRCPGRPDSPERCTLSILAL